MKPEHLISILILIIGVLIIGFAVLGYPGHRPPETPPVTYEYQVKVMDYGGRSLPRLNATLTTGNKSFVGSYSNDTGYYVFRVNATGKYRLLVYSAEGIKLVEKYVMIDMNKTEDLKLDVQPMSLKLEVNMTGVIEPLNYGVKFVLYNLTSNEKVFEGELGPGNGSVSISALPFGRYKVEGFWHTIKVVEDVVEVNGSSEEMVYTVDGRRVTLAVWDQNGSPVAEANVKLYYEGRRIILGRTSVERNTVNVTLPIRTYDVYVELRGINTTIIEGRRLDLASLQGDAFNITIGVVNASLKVLTPEGEPAVGYFFYVRGLEKIDSGRLGENATVELSNLPSGGWIVVTVRRGDILALNQTVSLPEYSAVSGVYNITLRISYVDVEFSVMDLKGLSPSSKIRLYVVDELSGRVLGEYNEASRTIRLTPGVYRFYVFAEAPDGTMRLSLQESFAVPFNRTSPIILRIPVGLSLNVELIGGSGEIKLYYVSAEGKRTLVGSSSSGKLTRSGLMAGKYIIDINNGQVLKYIVLRNDETIKIPLQGGPSSYILDIARLIIYIAIVMALLYLIYRFYRSAGGSS